MNLVYRHLEGLSKRGLNLRKTYTSDTLFHEEDARSKNPQALHEIVTFTKSKFLYSTSANPKQDKVSPLQP